MSYIDIDFRAYCETYAEKNLSKKDLVSLFDIQYKKSPTLSN